MLYQGELQLVMQSRRSEADQELLGKIYSHFLALRVGLDDLKKSELTHMMIDSSHELRMALEGLDRIIETAEIGHEMFKAYWYKGDLRHQIQEITDNYNA
jgi:hypothetical protein